MTFKRSSVRSCMPWKPVANDVKSQLIFQNGGQFTPITKFGQLKLSPPLILYGNKFKKIVIARQTYQGRSALSLTLWASKTPLLLKAKITTPARKSRRLSAIQQLISMAFHRPFTWYSDWDGASAMVALNAEHLCRVRNVLVDGGYSGVNFRLDAATVQVAKRNKLHCSYVKFWY